MCAKFLSNIIVESTIVTVLFLLFKGKRCIVVYLNTPPF